MNRITSISIISIVAVFALAGVFFLLAPASPAEACCGTGNETHSDNDRVPDPPRKVPPPPPPPVCVLSASLNSIKAGQSVTLTWSTANAVSVTLSGFGAVAANGSQVVTPAVTTTYTLTVLGGYLNDSQRQSKVCKATITVVPKVDVCPNLDGDQATIPPGYELKYGKCVPIQEEPKNPSCDMWVSPSKIKKGESALLSWESTNASTASIDQGLGGVSVDGSRTVAPNNTTTYTGSFTGYGKTVICKKTITVEKEQEEEDDLSCKLRVSDRTIRKGDRVKLSWESEGAKYGKINEGIGRVDEEGYEYVYPKEDTTYKATFYSDNDDDDTVTCKVDVDVEKEKYIPPPPQTPYITLSSVPYTGLDLGPVGTAVYWSFIMLWSVLAAYLVAVRRVHVGIYNFLFGTPAVQQLDKQIVWPAQPVTAGTGDVRTFAKQADAKPLDMDPFLASQIIKKS